MNKQQSVRIILVIVFALMVVLAGCSSEDDDGGGSVSSSSSSSIATDTSPDTTAPEVQTVSPTDHGTITSTSATINLTFNETMDASTVTVMTSAGSCSESIQLSDDNFTSCLAFASSPSSSDQTTFTLTPSGLQKEFYYQLKVLATVEDANGNTLGAAFTSDFVISDYGLVYLEGGSFIMGSGIGNESPAHNVDISGFYMMNHEVTAEEYRRCSDIAECNWSLPSSGAYTFYTSQNLPINGIDKSIADSFYQWLNYTVGTNLNYRLCSEAEWEYAARADTSTDYGCGDNTSSCLEDREWWSVTDPSADSTHQVMTKVANNWGLYDMLGNVSELVADTYASDYTSTPTDGSANTGGTNFVVRGGAYNSVTSNLRVTERYSFVSPNTTIGFRLCASP